MYLQPLDCGPRIGEVLKDVREHNAVEVLALERTPGRFERFLQDDVKPCSGEGRSLCKRLYAPDDNGPTPLQSYAEPSRAASDIQYRSSIGRNKVGDRGSLRIEVRIVRGHLTVVDTVIPAQVCTVRSSPRTLNPCPADGGDMLLQALRADSQVRC